MTRLSALVTLAVLALLPGVASGSFIDAKDVYQVGDTRQGPATISYQHPYDGSVVPVASVVLSIVAEGIDSPGPGDGEVDNVFFNGHFLGSLVQQSFYYADYHLQAGAGALGPPRTALTTSLFNIDPAWLLVGNNTIEIVVDAQSWIMEAETSTLTIDAVPEPTSMLLVGMGLLGLTAKRRRR